MARKMGDFIKIGFEQDVTIWKNKARIDNPLLCEEDGPVYQLRRWYEQFYVDVEDVTPEMTDRFEFEIRSEEHTSELQSLMRTSYAVFCLKKKRKQQYNP